MRQERKSGRSNVRLPVCGRPLMALTLAVTMLTAPCLTGCANLRKATRQERQSEKTALDVRTDSVLRLGVDSAYEQVEKWRKPVSVPMSSVRLTIATDSLRNLPSGAIYSGKSGQAGVQVWRKPSTATEPEYIYVYATCDSLQLLCEEYVRTIGNLRKTIAWQEAQSVRHELSAKSEETSKAFGTGARWLFVGLATGILGTTIIFFIKLRK